MVTCIMSDSRSRSQLTWALSALDICWDVVGSHRQCVTTTPEPFQIDQSWGILAHISKQNTIWSLSMYALG